MSDQFRQSLTILLVAIVAYVLLGIKGGSVSPPVAIIDAPGLHVLIVHETSEQLSKEQAAILTGTEWQAYVGKERWRVLDQHSEFNDPKSIWKAAIDRPSEHLPRVLVSNPPNGYEGPLPADNDAMLALVKKWGDE